MTTIYREFLSPATMYLNFQLHDAPECPSREATLSKEPELHSPQIDLNAPGGLEALFAFHRAQFGNATMEEGKPGESGGTNDGDKSKEGSQNDPPKDDDDDKNLPEGLGDAGKAAIKAERKARKEADRQLAEEKRQREEAERKLREREDKDLTDAQKAQRDAQETAQENAKLKTENLRLKALANHAVPKDYQYLVTGTDEASFEKSAKDIAELAAKANGSRKGPDPIPGSGGGTGSGGNDSGGSVAAGRDKYRARHPEKK